MRYLPYARTSPERYLIIALVVFFFVFLFNSYCLGKLSKPLALILGALFLAAVLFLVALVS